MILLPDTHFFLHFKDASELPWREVTQADHVRLVICRSVQRELDRMEHQLRGRPQKRAKKFAGLVGDLALGRPPLVLRNADPKVTLELAPRWPAGWQPPADLRPDWGDDMLVADALAFAAATGECAGLLCNDTGAYRTATEHNLGAVSVFLRARNWNLDPESDERDKENERLRREIAELQRAAPVIKVQVLSGNAEIKMVTIEAVRYAPLATEDLEALLKLVCRYYPMVSDFSRPSNSVNSKADIAKGVISPSSVGVRYGWRRPSKEAIRAYTEEAYPAWLREVRGWLEALPQWLQARTLFTDISFLLSNTGTRPAKEVLLTFKGEGGVLLEEPRPTRDQSNVRLRKPPGPPAPPEWTQERIPSPGNFLSSGLPDFDTATGHAIPAPIPPLARASSVRAGNWGKFPGETVAPLGAA
jgi:hypothetical protein